MNTRLYEAIRPVRGREAIIEKEGIMSRWANKSPGSFMFFVIAGWFSILIGSAIWIKIMD